MIHTKHKDNKNYYAKLDLIKYRERRNSNLTITIIVQYIQPFHSWDFQIQSFLYKNILPGMSQDAIRVVCRLRTFNKMELANGGQECVEFDEKNIKINLGGDQNKYNFAFDRIFGPTSVQVQVYQEVAIPVIKSVISGYNGTIFAYGQTGAGKTWTMQGPNHFDQQFKGLIPRTVDGLFEQIRESDQNIEFVIRCSYVEIYNQKLFDLLDPSKARLEVKEDKIKGIFIQNCTEIAVGSAEQMLKVMNNGSQNRKVAFTGMNERSSRSHSLFIIHVSQKNNKKQSTKQSKLYFVDLAGSQKVSKTGVMGQQLEQAKNINKSLSALGNVINALTSQKKEHVPYRDSKLTRILQESLGGNSKTTLIICCSMCSYNDKETLGTLRFGYRAKSIKNKAKMNEEKSAKQLLILLDAANKTIYELKMQLKTGVVAQIGVSEQSMSPQLLQQMQVQRSEIEELRKQLQERVLQEESKQRSLKELQFRMKSILLDVDREKQQHQTHMKECSSTYKSFKHFMQSINKYVKRATMDIEYFLNSAIANKISHSSQIIKVEEDNQKQNKQLRNSLCSFLKQSEEYLQFYQEKMKCIFQNVQREANYKDLNNFEIHSDEGNCEGSKENYFEGEPSFKSDGETDKRKMRIALSQPQLFAQEFQNNKQELQMSFIYQRPIQQSMAMTTSDKISQQQSFTEIETLLESLQTKESHKMLLQQLNSQLKMYKKENEELNFKNQKLKQQIKNIKKNTEKQLHDRYEEKIVDLEERVQEYKNIIGKKDHEIQQYFKKEDKLKKDLANQKVVSERFQKIIESNTSMKHYHDMEERVRTLASERQKQFNEMFKLREQLDQADLTIKEKDQHIESLKEVMKQLSQNIPSNGHKFFKDGSAQRKPESQQNIQRRYNTKVYGTEVPNVVQPIRGGDTGNKKSSLRRKIPIEPKTEQKHQKGGIGSYFKGFFG